MAGDCAELRGQARGSPADGGAGDAAQPPLSALLLIPLGLGLSLDRAVCRGDCHAEGSPQPEPQLFCLPTSSWLSATWQQWASQQSADAQTLAQALAAAQRGLALNDSYPRVTWLLGYVYLWQKQYEQAIAEMERAVALDPNEAFGYAVLAEVLSRVGRSEEAWRW